MNPAEWLVRAAVRRPGAPALMQGTRVLTDYAAFARRAGAVGAGLAARGVTPGERVALYLGNHPAYLEALYGIWFAGAAAVPINAKLHPREAAWILRDAGAVACFVAPDTPAGLPDLPLIDVAGPDYATLAAGAPLPGPVAMVPGALAWLFYTSGTTGRPKGVMITAANLVAMSLCYLADVDTVEPGDAALYAAPMSHGAGLYALVHVLRGARHVVPESGGFDPAEILALAPTLGQVSMFAAPTMVRRLVDRASATGTMGAGATGEGIKTVVYGGGPMYRADIEEAVAVMGPRFVQIYGQGESPMTITALARELVADRSHPRWAARLASVGVAQSAVRVRVADAEGRTLPPDETGEILVSGATVMAGYWQNPAATAETIRDGWLWTGDLGSMDRDGFLTLQDRSKDVIISGGTNIYPREVEEALLTHADVHEVAVVGAPHPEWGEEVVAFVSSTPGAALDPAALDRHCLDRIARFKRPRRYVAAQGLPKNNYGKVLKTELRRRLAEGER
ncbi:MAG: AMP-binding protein [Pseudomonadota bacterium]